MNDHGTFPAGSEDLADRLHRLSSLQAVPRLSGEEVRGRGVRRRRIRHGAMAFGGGTLALAGVFVAVLLSVGHGPTAVVQPVVGHTATSAPAKTGTSTPVPRPRPTTPAAIGTANLPANAVPAATMHASASAHPGPPTTPSASVSSMPFSPTSATPTINPSAG